MASRLNWKNVRVPAPASPVTITVTGNVDTRVATRYFWLPVADTQTDQFWDRDDGVPLVFDATLIGSNRQNHLGFSCQAAPLVRSQTNLFLMLQLRQGNEVLLEQSYPLTVADPTILVSLRDGIALTR